MAMVALLAARNIVAVVPEQEGPTDFQQDTKVLEVADYHPPTRSLREIIEVYQGPSLNDYYDWETDPAVLSRPIEDTMPSVPGVWGTPRHFPVKPLFAYRRSTSLEDS